MEHSDTQIQLVAPGVVRISIDITSKQFADWVVANDGYQFAATTSVTIQPRIEAYTGRVTLDLLPIKE
jgi:hypothetical protein